MCVSVSSNCASHLGLKARAFLTVAPMYGAAVVRISSKRVTVGKVIHDLLNDNRLSGKDDSAGSVAKLMPGLLSRRRPEYRLEPKHAGCLTPAHQHTLV